MGSNGNAKGEEGYLRGGVSKTSKVGFEVFKDFRAEGGWMLVYYPIFFCLI